MDDALPIRNLTIATIGMGEQLRTAISFKKPTAGKLWMDFMEMFSMLYGITKWWLHDVTAKEQLAAFMATWFKYGFAVSYYHDLTVKVAQKILTPAQAAPGLEEAQDLFKVVNPKTSLDMMEILVQELVKKGIFSIKESTIIDEREEDARVTDDVKPGEVRGQGAGDGDTAGSQA